MPTDIPPTSKMFLLSYLDPDIGMYHDRNIHSGYNINSRQKTCSKFYSIKNVWKSKPWDILPASVLTCSGIVESFAATSMA